MGDKTKIEWSDATLNFATGCTKVSPACDACYMYREYPRLRGWGVRGYETDPDTVTVIPERITKMSRYRNKRVFVNSMSDTFHRDVPFEVVEDFMVAARWRHEAIFQVLTKRPGRAEAFWHWLRERGWDAWPENVWLGTSVETQKYAPRIDVLARVPAPVRFVSAEPLLGPVDLSRWLPNTGRDPEAVYDGDPEVWKPGMVHWVIVGGESGPHARHMEHEWARSLLDQCHMAGVPFFMKQMSRKQPIPDSLMVREYPETPRPAMI